MSEDKAFVLENLKLPRTEKGRGIYWEEMNKELTRRPHLPEEDRHRIARDITATRLKNEGKIERLKTDSLTGLLNERGFKDALKIEASRAKRTGRPLTIAFLDLNGLHDINQEKGHKGGDEVLRSLAESMISVSRESDRLARIGGDEFIVILHDTDIEEAKLYWERLFPELKKRGIVVSAGISSVDVSNEYTVAESIDLADIAMYKAKTESKKTGASTMRTMYDLTADEILNREKVRQQGSIR